MNIHAIPQRIKNKLVTKSARWRYFLMLALLIVVATVSLIISDSILLNALTKENLQKMQITLERDCDELSNTIYASGMIPSAIESTPYYEYIKTNRSGSLPDKYAAVLAYIGKTFRKQTYLSQGSAHGVLYLKGVNSICTSSYNHIVAEECFEYSVNYENLSGHEILELLNSDGQELIVPVQKVSLYGHSPEKYLTYLVSTRNSAISVMTMYREDYVLKRLGIETLPFGTEVTITDSSGNLIERYPENAASDPARYYVLTSNLKRLDATVTLKIPRTYFMRLLKPATIGGVVVIAMTLLVGILLSLFLSRKSVEPLHDILTKHQPNKLFAGHINEYVALDGLILQSKQDKQTVEKLLAENLLVATISKPLLSEENVQLMMAQIPQMQKPFRIAILHVIKNTNDILMPYLMEEYFSGQFTVVQLDKFESGIVVPDEKEKLNLFTDQIRKVSEHLHLAGFFVSCGISAPIEDIRNLQDAAKQARLALPINGGIELYCAREEKSDGWAMKEIDCLYQYLLANRREDARFCLKNIVSKVDAVNAEMVFNGLLLVLESIRSEFGFEKDESISFKKNLIPMENMAAVCQSAECLIVKLEQLEHNTQLEEEERVILYINRSFSDADLCAASVAEQMGLPEKKVQIIVKNLTGLSFSAYLLKVRMEQAKKLLCETQLGVKSIGEQCGYRVESTFFRTFRRYYDATPMEFRNDNADGTLH